MPRQRAERRQRRRGHLVHELSRRLAEHELTIYASAIAFRALVSVIPLALLGLGLLGALGLQSTWRKSVAPAIKPRVIPQVYDGINASAEKILHSGTAGVIAFASALAIWDLAIGMSAVMRALNVVHDVEEDRSALRRTLVAVALAGGPRAGAVAGFAAGLLADLAPPADHPAGRLALVFALVGYLAGLAREEASRSALLPIAIVAFAAWFFLLSGAEPLPLHLPE
jgi:uncharacterized BrkB/YihY/UPF0761 family membrane protein